MSNLTCDRQTFYHPQENIEQNGKMCPYDMDAPPPQNKQVFFGKWRGI